MYAVQPRKAKLTMEKPTFGKKPVDTKKAKAKIVSEPGYDELQTSTAMSRVEKSKPQTKSLALSPSAKGSGKTFNVWSFWLLALFSLFLAQVPFISLLFMPVTQFTTMVHELSHALVCLATGGWVGGLTIVPDGAGHGGLTYCHNGLPFFYTQAGYLGTAVFGCFLIFLGQFTKLSKYVLVCLGTAMALASLLIVGPGILTTGFSGFFSLLWGLAMAAGLIYAGVKWKPTTANLLLLFLAIQTALNSVVCILYLVQIYFGFASTAAAYSDASAMAQMTAIPAFVWSAFWFLTSVAMVAFTLWHTYGKEIFGKQVKVESRIAKI
jgi:Peptidase M50B-like